MRKTKPKRHGQSWTEEEKEYLISNWGLVTIKTLEKKLQRTQRAIRAKATEFKLGRKQYAQGLLFSPNQVAKILKIDNHVIYRWIEEKRLKAMNKKLIDDNQIYQIRMEDLEEFLQNNLDAWDSRRLDLYALGTEPKWLQEKRKKDMQLPVKQGSFWTEEEEKRLISYLKSGLEVKKIAKRMGRTEKSIYAKAKRLRDSGGNLKPRKIMLYWTNEEVEIMLEMEKQGYTDDEIAYQLGRERIHIVDKRRNMREKGKYQGHKTGYRYSRTKEASLC